MTPGTTSGGSFTLRLLTVPAASTGTLAVDGPSITVDFSPGQIGSRTFRGIAGQRLRLTAGSSSTLGDVDYRVNGPDGSPAAYGYVYGGTTYNTYEEFPSFAVTGTYTIRLYPQGGAYGSLRLELGSIAPDSTGTLTLDRSSTVSFTVGQNAVRTVPCTAGESG